jgi:uncharacterized protein (DUF2336 family)
MLERLSKIARVKCSDSRRELMGEIANLFVADSENYNDRELFLFGEILAELLHNVDLEAKVQLSETMAPIDNIPHDLAMLLANQESEIATPVLEQSSVLSDKDLVEIAHTKSSEHRIAISRRNTLSHTVTDALIAELELPVLLSVCGNKGAEISDKGFSILADSAAGDENLCESLSHHADMPMEILSRVIPLMSTEAQARIMEIAENQGDSTVNSLIEKARRLSKEKHKNSSREIVHSHSLLEEIQGGKMELEPVIELLCKENRPLDIGYVLSGLTNVPQKQIVNALLKKNGKAIIVLCRALDFSQKAFSFITAFRTKRLKLHASTCDRENREFADLDSTAAKRTMRFIQVRNVASAA